MHSLVKPPEATSNGMRAHIGCPQHAALSVLLDHPRRGRHGGHRPPGPVLVPLHVHPWEIVMLDKYGDGCTRGQ